MTAITGKLIFAEYDPYFALFNFWSSEVSLIGLTIRGMTLGLSFFVERPWCKYACPYGAVLGITNLFRVFGIRRNQATCKADGACSILCPKNIPVDSKTVVRDHQCISCLECTSEAVCPVINTVRSSLPEVQNDAEIKTPGSIGRRHPVRRNHLFRRHGLVADRIHQ